MRDDLDNSLVRRSVRSLSGAGATLRSVVRHRLINALTHVSDGYRYVQRMSARHSQAQTAKQKTPDHFTLQRTRKEFHGQVLLYLSSSVRSPMIRLGQRSNGQAKFRLDGISASNSPRGRSGPYQRMFDVPVMGIATLISLQSHACREHKCTSLCCAYITDRRKEPDPGLYIYRYRIYRYILLHT